MSRDLRAGSRGVTNKNLVEDRRIAATRGSLALRIAAPLVLFTIAIVAWAIATRGDSIANIVLPSPGEVFKALVEFRVVLVKAAGATVFETLFGFGLACVGGVLLAMGLSYSRVVNAAAYPGLVVFHAIPTVALAPLFIIWFGFGLPTKVIVAFLTAIFPIAVSTTTGLNAVQPELRDLGRTLHASRFRSFWKIDLPFALPFFFAGLRVAITLALVGAIVGEFVVGDAGLAVQMQRAGALYLTDLAFATVIVICIVGVSLFAAIVLLERLVTPWRRPTR